MASGSLRLDFSGGRGAACAAIPFQQDCSVFQEMNAEKVLTTVFPGSFQAKVEDCVRRFTEEKMAEITSVYSSTASVLEKNGVEKKTDKIFQKMIARAQGCRSYTFIYNKTSSSFVGTFLSSLPVQVSSQIRELPDVKKYIDGRSVKLVFKWARVEDQYIQEIYNRIYRAVGFITPCPVVRNGKVDVFERICRPLIDEDIVNEDTSLAVALAFRASSMQTALEGGALDHYSAAQWTSIFREIGRVTTLDMVLGNHDRVLQPIDGDLFPTWNLDNFMIDLQTSRLYFIDNGIMTELLPRVFADSWCPDFEGENPMEEEERVGCSSLYEIDHGLELFLENCKSPSKLDSLSRSVISSFFTTSGSRVRSPDVERACRDGWCAGVKSMIGDIRADATILNMLDAAFASEVEGDREFRCELLGHVNSNFLRLSGCDIQEMDT